MNAATSDSQTSYYFHVNNKNLETVLKVWSRFFIDPLFDKDSTQKEINAVNGEYVNKFGNQLWKITSLLRQCVNPAHGYSKFMIGNT